MNVSAIENNVSKSQPEKKPLAAKSTSVFQSPCLYCQKNHALNACNKIREQPLKERIQFLKTNGLCFGCLTAGHMSKDCKKGPHVQIVHSSTQLSCMLLRKMLHQRTTVQTTGHKARVKSQVLLCLQGAEKVTILGPGTMSVFFPSYLCR